MLYNFKKALTLSCYFAVVAMLLLPYSVSAQTPISPNTWTGQGSSAPGPSTFTSLPASVIPGAAVVNVSQWNRAPTVTNTVAGACYDCSSWQVGGSLAAAQAAAKYIFFTITNDAATELQVTQLFVMSQVSATGPESVQLAYAIGAGPDILYGGTLPTMHSATPENFVFNGNMCIAPSQTATFKLYGWGATGSAGTLRINNGTSITAVFAAGITSSSASNSSPICAGNPLSFTGSFTGGVPGYTFSWSGPGGFSSPLQNPVIPAPTAAATGIYSFTVTDALTCTASVAAATTSATVTAAPAPISGATVVCQGQTTAFSDTDPGGSWSSSAPGTADVGTATGIVSGINPGTAIITYSIGTSCIATVIVTANQAPGIITGTPVVCVGLTTALGNSVPGGTWVSGAPGTASVDPTGLVTGGTPGTAVITYTLPAGCFATVVVTVNAFPSLITGPTNVCSGATIILSDASPGGTWSSSSPSTASVGATTGIVTGGAFGVVTIIYTLPGGCATSYTVTVNPLPSAIGGTPVVCENAVTNLNDPTPGGTWSSSAPPTATVSSSGAVFGFAAGVVTISYILTATGCYQTRSVTVNATPPAITGPAGVCIGSSVTLNNAMPGGTWISSNTFVATIGSSSGTVASGAVGTTTITYRLTVTGCFITRTETVNPLPGSITGPGTVCPTTTITLSDLPGGGTWASNPTTIATVVAATGDVTGVAAGTATITYTLPTGCTATTVITVNPAPLSIITPIGDTDMCPGDIVTLTANTGAGLTYQWYVAGSPITGALTSVYFASTTGAYQVQVTNTLGCATLSIPMNVSVNPATATITVPGGSLSGCSATGVELDANTGAGLSYQWVVGGVSIPGATASSYTATTPGDYSVVVSNTTGCSATSAIETITIYPSPAGTVSLSGPTTFCQGSHVIITAAAGSGLTYQWHNTAGSITGATSVSYTATLSGSYWADVTNGFGCTISSVVTVVVANPLPDVTITPGGPIVFCAGGNVTLFAAAVAGFTYQWYKSGTAIPGATNSSYTATLTGGYRVRITNPGTGCNDMTHTDMTVTNVNTPVIVPLTPAKFCWGGSSLLSTSVSSVGPAVSYQWFLNGVAITGATTSTWSAGVTGNYSCTISIPGSCIVTTAAQPVTELPLPDPIISFNGTVLSTAPFYVTYQWYKNLVMITGATAATTVPTGNGSYKVLVTDTNGCQSASSTYVLTGWHGTGATGVGMLAPGEIRIYPNPANNVLHIESIKNVRAVISSMDGRTITDQVIARDIDISNLANGMYMIMLYDEHGQMLQADKFVKQGN